MAVLVRVPNFRLPSRLIQWMQNNCVRERVPSAEKVFLDSRISVAERAWGLSMYAKMAGELPAEFEDIIASSPEAAAEYAGVRGSNTPMKIMDACGVSATMMVKLASKLHGRIPAHLEDKIKTPDEYAAYSCEIQARIPEMEERILFSGNFPAENLARVAAKIIDKMTPYRYGVTLKEGDAAIDPRLKELVKGSVDAVCEYMEFLGRRGMRLEPEFHYIFAGNGQLLLKLANHLNRRLPEDLERTWKGAKSLVAYTLKFVRMRLPDYLEEVLVGDQQAACQYAFEVVRGFSSPRLSDELHKFMLLKSFENPEDGDIKRYFAECERVSGNN